MCVSIVFLFTIQTKINRIFFDTYNSSSYHISCYSYIFTEQKLQFIVFFFYFFFSFTCALVFKCFFLFFFSQFFFCIVFKRFKVKIEIFIYIVNKSLFCLIFICTRLTLIDSIAEITAFVNNFYKARKIKYANASPKDLKLN